MKNYLFYLATVIVLITAYSCEKEESGIENNDNLSALPDGLVTLKSGVTVEKKSNDYLIEGDIVLSPTQLKNLDEYGELITKEPQYIGADTDVHPVYNIPMTTDADNATIPRAFSIYPTSYNLWAMVRFVYNSNLTATERAKIKSALEEIEASTNVRFYNATGEDTYNSQYGFYYPYIDFYSTGNVDTSSSYLGRIGGRQQISLADFALTSWNNRTIIHEINHALGLRHEHTRTDRNNYITVNTSNLTSSGLSQFTIPSTNYYQTGTYDYTSIMGYSSYTSATSAVHDISLPMYTKLDGSTIATATTLSSSDRSWMNYFHVPYIARSDTYRELAPVVYKSDNTIMTAAERLAFQAYLNNGNSTPPNCCRIPNDF